jgi:hypothetical protein
MAPTQTDVAGLVVAPPDDVRWVTGATAIAGTATEICGRLALLTDSLTTCSLPAGLKLSTSVRVVAGRVTTCVSGDVLTA